MSKVESCFRRRGRSARIRFLSDIKKPLQERYGFLGEEIPLRRKALIYWSRDRFKESREILNYLLAESIKRQQEAIQASTLFTLARVDENEGMLEKAVETYDNFLKSFPEDEKSHEARTTLIMLNTILDKQSLALGHAKEAIRDETMKGVNERDSSTLAFALFWAGKLSLHLGNREASIKYWRRVASEYYSTFYGAVGHYMLEQMLGKRLVLQPARVPQFDKAK